MACQDGPPNSVAPGQAAMPGFRRFALCWNSFSRICGAVVARVLGVPSAATARQRDADLHRRRPQTRSWRGATLTRSPTNHSVGHKIREMDEPVLPASKALVVGFFACHCSYSDTDRLLSRKRRLTRTASDAFSASPRTIMTSFIERPEHNTAMLESK